MPDVLSQGEIDALLSAAGDPARKAGGARAEQAQFRYYDFLRPERASPAAMRALSDLHEAAARSLGAAFSAALRSPVDCRLRGLVQLAWGEFVVGLANPTCLAVIAAGPPGRERVSPDNPKDADPAPGGRQAALRMAIEIGPSLLFPMIERLLGAPESAPEGAPGGASRAGVDAGAETGAAVGAADVPARPLTAIERRVSSAVVEIALGPIEEMFSRARPVALELVRLESNPQIVTLAPAAEMAAVAAFDVTFGASAGLVHLAVPFAEWGGVLGDLAASTEAPGGAGGPTPDTSRPSPLAASALARVPVRVEAVAYSVRMPIREVAGLSAGDDIDIGPAFSRATAPRRIAAEGSTAPATSAGAADASGPAATGGDGAAAPGSLAEAARQCEVVVAVGGKPKFRATECVCRGRRAFRIAGLSGDTELILGNGPRTKRDGR